MTKKKAPFLREHAVTLLLSTDLTVQLRCAKPGRRAFLLTPQLLRQLGIEANERARAYNYEKHGSYGPVSFTFSQDKGGIRLTYPVRDTYRVSGDKVVAPAPTPEVPGQESEQRYNSPSPPAPPANPAPSKDVQPPLDSGLSKDTKDSHPHGEAAFAARGQKQSPRAFSLHEHGEKFNFLHSGIEPTRYKHDRGLAKSFRQNCRRRYRISSDGHLQYKRATTSASSLTAQLAAALCEYRTIPFADEEWDIVASAHQRNHKCINALERMVNQQYAVHELRDIALEVRKRCVECEKFAPPHKVGPTWILTSRPGQIIMFDLSTLKITLEDGTALHMLLVVDHFTKYRWATLFTTKDHGPICDYMFDLMRKEGTPERWHADNGTEFKNKFMDRVRARLSLNDEQLLPYSHSLPRNPMCQGLVERANRTVKTKLVKAFNDWRRENPASEADVTLAVVDALLQDVINEDNITVLKLYQCTPHFLQRGKAPYTSSGHKLCPILTARIFAACAKAQVKQAYKNASDYESRNIFEEYTPGRVVRIASTTQKMEKKEAPFGMRWPWLATITRRTTHGDHLYRVTWIEQGPTTYDKPGKEAKRAFHATQIKPGTDAEQDEHGYDDPGATSSSADHEGNNSGEEDMTAHSPGHILKLVVVMNLTLKEIWAMKVT